MIMKPVDTLGNTARDFYLKLALDKEILRAKEAEKLLNDKEVKEMVVETSGSNLILSLVSNDGVVIDSKTLPIDAKIITNVVFDAEEKALIFSCNDGSEIVCDISSFIDFVTGKIDTLNNAFIALTRVVDDEEERALSAERQLQDNIDAETTRATAAEESLGNRIDGLDLNEVGASGSYIKLVSQSNGQLSASAQALDTEITAQSDDNNAPTSEAVKEYVDAGDAVLVPKPINPVDGKAYVLTYTTANGFTWVAVDTVIVSN